MKKMLRVFGIIAVAVCLIISIVACDKKDDDNSIDVVAISENEYASVEDALKGYVKEELAYSAVDDYDGKVREVVVAEYVSNESKGEVVIDKINLSDTQKTNLVSAEKVAVKAKIDLATVKEAEASEVTQTVYVLKYGDKYKFMVSTPEDGERLTNSYVEIFTDATKYANCTLIAVSMDKEEEDEKPAFYAANEIKFTAEVGYQVRYYNEARYNNRTPGSDEDTCDRVSYFVMKGDKVATVGNRISDDKEVWTAEYLNNSYYKDINTVSDYNKFLIQTSVLSMFIEAPAALYTKTVNGFEFKIELVDKDGDKENYEYRFAVSDGKITDVYRKEASSWTDEDEGITYVESYETNIMIKDFGTTTAVSIPEYVTEALSQLEA